MFTIDSKIEGKHPIAYIKGLEPGDKKKFLYLSKYKPDIKDLKNFKLIEHLTEEQKKEIADALSQKREPDSEDLVKTYYNVLDDLKNNTQRIVLKRGKLFPLPNPNKVERLFVCGISGSGKSYFSAEYIKRYLVQNRKNEFYLTSTVQEDQVLDELDPNRISPQELTEFGVDLNDMTNSIWAFDDVLSIRDTSIRKDVLKIIEHLAETSRHDKISLLVTSHLINNGVETRKILNESTKVVLFPKSNRRNIKVFLENYESFTSDDIKRFINLPSRYVMLDKSGDRPVILYEKGAYIM
jgi:adenylate kinase family enzyme